MSLKLVLLACLIGTAFAVEKGDDGDCDDKSTRGSGENDDKESNDSYKWWDVKDKDDCLKSLQYVYDEVKEIIARRDDLKLGGDAKKWSAAYNKATDDVAKISLVYGKLIESVYPGLGSKFTDMCIAHLTTTACVYVTKEIRKWHGVTLPDLCNKVDYGHEWGCHGAKGYNTIDEVRKGYGVQDATKQIDELINKYTHGKGLKGIDEKIRTAVESVRNFAVFVDKLKPKFHPQEFIGAVDEYFVALGGLGNSVKKEYGTRFITDLKKFYDVVYLEAGYPDLGCILEDVYKRISTCSPYDWPKKSNKDNKDEKGGKKEDGKGDEESNVNQDAEIEQTSNDD